MIKLKENPKLFKKYCENLEKVLKENPEIEHVPIPKNINDIFLPYSDWIKSLTPEDRKELHIIEDADMNFDGIYITRGLNDAYVISMVTDFEANRLARDFYGISDNATQILKISERVSEDAVLLMTPIFKKGQPEKDGWRWHKWGPYCGVQNPVSEYLHDEPDIEMIYVYELVPVVSKTKESRGKI